MATETLTVDMIRDTANYGVEIYTVVDEEGGRWWPSDEAADEIKASDSPRATALRICRETPMRGTWAD